MSDLLQDTPAALRWAEEAERRHAPGKFGVIVRAVVWTDTRNADGELQVDVDPVRLVAQINSHPFIVLHNHDPGLPKGMVFESESFESAGGRKFVAALIGYYEGGDVLSFRDLGLDHRAFVPPPEHLPALPEDLRIEIATDSREVEGEWLDQVADDSPVSIERTELSHNAADLLQELIRIGIPYAILVWNPYVKAIASEAGKATYAGIHGWLRRLLSRMADRRSPILDFHSFHDDCQISFLYRGKDVKKLHEALDASAAAAVQAARLVSRLRDQGMTSKQLVYEFDKEAILWAPSFVVLDDGRIITDNLALISIENLPKGLSLGMTRTKSL